MRHLLLAATFLCLGLTDAAAATLAGKNNKCLDIVDGRAVNGGKVQLWDCAQGNRNQQWEFANGQLRSSGKCLDVVDGRKSDGAAVQLWDCFAGSANQAWEQAGNNVRLRGTNFCLDVRNNTYSNGSTLQIYTCDWRGTSSNQFWTTGGSAPANKPRSDGDSFYGYSAISLDAFMQKNSFCAWLRQPIEAASRDIGINATFLASVCVVESSCKIPANGWGLWQFSDDRAWAAFGLNKNRNDPYDSAYAAARYFKALLEQFDGNLDKALRFYNGPVENGGSPSYQADLKTWMRGDRVW